MITQRTEAQRVRITSDGIKLVPLPMRYADPPELDLMARIAGLAAIGRRGRSRKTAPCIFRKPA